MLAELRKLAEKYTKNPLTSLIKDMNQIVSEKRMSKLAIFALALSIFALAIQFYYFEFVYVVQGGPDAMVFYIAPVFLLLIAAIMISQISKKLIEQHNLRGAMISCIAFRFSIVQMVVFAAWYFFRTIN